MSKNEDSLDVLLDNFVNKTSLKNLYVLFINRVAREIICLIASVSPSVRLSVNIWGRLAKC